ncbi:MAG: PQQ-binding-like beta-propeller repeat protein [bacterium]|nr:PQQ-binding-like beta-propeller repeat protein [bacterium]
MVISVGLASAQDHPAAEQPKGFQPNPFAPDDNGGPAQAADVYLHDSFEADEWLANARRRSSAGNWDEAARLLGRVVETHADKITAVAPGHFIGIPARVASLVASWPEPGLTAYRSAVGPRAAELLDQARHLRQIEPLLDVADRYFCTRAGAEAADLAAQLALEQGSFPLAIQTYGRLVTQHPDRAELASTALPRLAIACAVDGRTEEARRHVKQARHDGRDSPVVWMGRSQPLTPLIESILSEVQPSTPSDEAFSWPVFGGDWSRNRTIALELAELAVLWRTEGIGDAAMVPEDERTSAYRRSLGRGRFLSANPIVGRDTAYVQDSRHVWAVQLGSGKRAWRYDALSSNSDQAFANEGELPRWYAPALNDGRVYACLGAETISYYGYEPPESSSSLVCLDAADGRVIWRVGRDALGANAEEMDFEASPLGYAGQVYTVVRRKRQFGFEDCFLYRFDADDGSTAFATHLGSASTGGFGYRRATLTIPTVCRDVIYVVSNLGTIAAVDRHSGRLRWLRRYERISEAQWRREGRGSSHGLRPWEFNPLLCVDDRLYALPTDANQLLVLDRATGETLHDVPLKDMARVQSLLGVAGDRIFGIGRSVFCYDLRAGAMVWQVSLSEDREPHGRGLLTGEHLLVPTQEALCAFARADGTMTVQSWEVPGGGNLLAVPGQLLVAGDDSLTAYARKADVLDRLHRRMKASPTDPLPALDLAEILFRTGDPAESVAVLDQAIARAGTFAQPIEDSIKRRIFEDCLAFANALTERSDADSTLPDALYSRASQCPPDTTAALTYRIHWAAYCEKTGRFDQAVDLFQQIIADRTLRETVIDDVAGAEPVPAGHQAELAIARLIAAHGRTVYERFDRQAAALLATAASAADFAALDRLVATYPNAQAAADALVTRGDLLRQGGDSIAAAGAYYAALARFPDRIDAPRRLQQIADCYLEAGRPDHAWRWLTKAAREHPTATVKAKGRKLTFLEYRERLGDLRARVEPSRRRLMPPLSGRYERQFDGPAEVLEPRFGDAPQTDWSTCLVHENGRLRAFRADNDAELWTEAVPCPVRPRLLAATSDRFLLATRHRLFALDARTGRSLWQLGRRPAGIDEPEADPEDFAGWVSFGLADNMMVALRDDGTAVCLEVDTGQVIWKRDLDHRPGGLLAVSPPLVAYQSARYGDPIYCLLDASSGAVTTVIDPQNPRQPVHLLLSLEGRLLVVTAETIDCYDPTNGRRLWQVRRDEGIVASAVRLDVDGLYLSDGAGRIEKLRLADGHAVWQFELASVGGGRGAEGLTITLHDGQVLLTTERQVLALAPQDGRVLWEGTVPRGVRFRHRFVTRFYLVGVDSPPEHFQDQRVVYFYDLRGASGLIPTSGGVNTLGVFDDVKQVSVRDGAVLLLDGQTLHAWTNEPGP